VDTKSNKPKAFKGDSTWVATLMPFVENSTAIFHCPSVQNWRPTTPGGGVK